MSTLNEINQQIKRLSLDIRGYQMARYNAVTRSEKIKWTKKIKAAEQEKSLLKKERNTILDS